MKISSLFGDEELEQKIKFRNSIWSMDMSPDYYSSGKVVIAADKITLCERGLLGSRKSTVLHSGIGTLKICFLTETINISLNN